MKKPNVLILCPFYPPNLGGVETHLQLLTDYLNDQKFKVFVLTYRPLVSKVASYKPYEKNGRVTIRRFWWFTYGLFDKTTPYPILQFLYVVPGLLVQSFFWMLNNHQRVDVIHTHGFAASFVARILTLFFPKRKVISTHFIYRKLDPGSLYAKLFKWVLADFDKILLIGKESGRQLTTLGLDEKKMVRFHHWLPSSYFIKRDKEKHRQKTGLPKSKMAVLFVGRILKMKGLFELLKAAKSLPKEILFVIVGDGPDADLLKSQAKGVSNYLMIGRKSHEEVFDFLGACDFLILPSLTEEAQPMVVMESLACGRPVVTTNKGAVSEMYDETVGVVINPTYKNITNVILDFYKNPQKLAKLTEKAKPYALQKYSQKNAKIITGTYQ